MSGGELLPGDKRILPHDAFGILLIGPSGVGKSSTAEELERQGVIEIKPTWAVRELRPSEVEEPPRDHIFKTQKEFDTHKQAGGFVDAKLIYGNWYGVPWPAKVAGGQVPLMVLKPDFVEPVLEQYPNMLTYQLEASEATVRKRMHGRRQTDSDIAHRIRQHAKETAIGRRLADCIFKNEGPLERTLEQLTEQIHADHVLYLATQALSEAAAPQMDATMEAPYDAESFA